MSAALALVRREEAYVDGKVLCVHDLEHAKSFEHAVVEFFMQLFDSVLYRKQSAIRFLSRSATGRGGQAWPPTGKTPVLGSTLEGPESKRE